MAVQASIKIEFSTFYQDHVIIPLVQTLLDGGWTLNSGGKISYLPIGHNDTSNWIRDTDISHNELMEVLKEKDYKKEPIGHSVNMAKY